MHTVCRFCHYLSQVDRYAQFACAYCCNRCLFSHGTKNRLLHLKNQINMCRRTRYFLKNWQTKGNILLKQTAQALIRLHRYLGMQSQLTMHAIAFSWTLLSKNTGDVTSAMTQKTVLAKTNKVSPQAHSHSLMGLYIQGRCFYLSEQHGL